MGPEGVAAARLKAHPARTAMPQEQAPDERLEEVVHGEEQSDARLLAGIRALTARREHHAGQRGQAAEPRGEPVEADRFVQRPRALRDVVQPVERVAKRPPVGVGAGYALQHPGGGLQQPVERRVGRQLLVAAGEALRRRRQRGELTPDVERSAETGEIRLARGVELVRPALERGQKAAREDADQRLEDVMLRPRHGGVGSRRQLQVVGDREHPHQRLAGSRLAAVDLGEDLQRSPARMENAADLPGVKRAVPPRQDRLPGQAKLRGGRLRQRGEAPRLGVRQPFRADLEAPPFVAGEDGLHSAASRGGEAPLSSEPPMSSLHASRPYP